MCLDRTSWQWELVVGESCSPHGRQEADIFISIKRVGEEGTRSRIQPPRKNK
jgi:hypothetical protein